jgi:hypothetical protein
VPVGVVAVPVPNQVALGKLPKRSDPRTLSLPKLLTGEIESARKAHNEPTGMEWGDLGNLQHKDCAIAAAAHAEMLWAAKYGRPLPKPITTEKVLDDYSKITGYKDGDPETDKGADLLSVLKYWRQTGILGQQIGAFAEILPHDVETLKWAIVNLDLAYVGLQLPVAWKTPAAKGQQPRFAPTRKPWNPATWQNPYHGHCVIYTGYDEDKSFTCVSWGEVITVPIAFHKAYCDEAYAIIAPEQLDAPAETPEQLRGPATATAKLDTAALKTTLALARKWPGPLTSPG